MNPFRPAALLAVAFLAMASAPALAQTEAQLRATALIGPMLQEVAPGRGGEIFTECVVASATPEELATMAAASAPSAEIGTLITAILNRPETLACAEAAIRG